MSAQKPLFRNVLEECLNKRLFPQLLSWISYPFFFVNMMRINNGGWSPEYAQHYVHWDQENYIAGCQDRKPGLSTEYYTSSRHRFQQALNQQKVIERCPDMDNGDLKAYRWLPNGQCGQTLSSSRPGADSATPPQEVELVAIIIVQTTLAQNVGRSEDLQSTLDAPGNLEYNNSVGGDANLQAESSVNENSLVTHTTASDLVTVSSFETSSHSFHEMSYTEHTHPGLDDTSPHPQIPSNSGAFSPSAQVPVNMHPSTDTLQTIPNDWMELDFSCNSNLPTDSNVEDPVRGYSTTDVVGVPVNMYPSTDTLPILPNDWLESELSCNSDFMSVPQLFSTSDVTTSNKTMDDRNVTLQIPPNDRQDCFALQASTGVHVPVNAGTMADTLRTPPNLSQEHISAFADRLVNGGPVNDTMQTPPNDVQETSPYTYPANPGLCIEPRSESIITANQNQCEGDDYMNWQSAFVPDFCYLRDTIESMDYGNSLI